MLPIVEYNDNHDNKLIIIALNTTQYHALRAKEQIRENQLNWL